MISRRQVTDRMNERCNKKVDWGALGSLLKVFHEPFVYRMVGLLPDYVCADWTNIAKVKYLYGICRKNAQPSDYKKKEKKELFNLKDFKL